MKWLSASEQPTPEPWFTKELKKIDPTLRVVWGQERYIKDEWAIERKTPAERYWLMYESIVTSDAGRFVEQPVYDCEQPIHDPETNEFVSYKQVGTRQYDLAPEYEWVAFCPPDGLTQKLLTTIKKLYWERDHPGEAEAEVAAKDEAKTKQDQTKRDDAVREGTDEFMLETEQVRQFGYGKVRAER